MKMTAIMTEAVMGLSKMVYYGNEECDDCGQLLSKSFEEYEEHGDLYPETNINATVQCKNCGCQPCQ